jgi:hypothetical protein
MKHATAPRFARVCVCVCVCVCEDEMANAPSTTLDQERKMPGLGRALQQNLSGGSLQLSNVQHASKQIGNVSRHKVVWDRSCCLSKARSGYTADKTL